MSRTLSANPFEKAQAEAVNGVLGEIVTWHSPKEVSHDAIVKALADSGMPASLAPDLQNRNAFKRAVSSLEEKRIVRKVTETENGDILFQLTEEAFDGTTYEYNNEGVVILNKDTGQIRGSVPEPLLDRVRDGLAHELSVRHTADITRMLQRVYDRSGDIVPLRPSGGVYFVPAKFRLVCDQVEKFMTLIGGDLRRVEVPAGGKSELNIAKAVNDDVVSMANELVVSARELSGEKDVSKQRMKNLLEKINAGRTRLEFYRVMLGTMAEHAATTLAEAKSILAGTDVPAEPAVSESPSDAADDALEEDYDEEDDHGESEGVANETTVDKMFAMLVGTGE